MSYSVITDDNFTRANTTAGTVTGPGTFNPPSTGAAYSDIKGNTYSINNNSLINAGLSNTDYSDAYLLRPISEAILNSQTALTGISGNTGSNLIAVGRYQASVGAYCASFYYVNGVATFSIGRLGTVAGAFTSLVSTTNVSGVNGTQATIVTLTAQGSSPTSLTATIALASAPGTILATLNTTDSTSGLQVAGQQGISANIGTYNSSTVNATASHLTVSQFTGLTIGALTATCTQQSISLALSTGASGGSGTGYQYKIQRGLTPNFTPDSTTLLATLSTAPTSGSPYVDNTAVAGIEYWYGITVTDSANNTMYALPAGLGAFVSPPNFIPYVGAMLFKQGLIINHCGDSITYGATLPSNAGTILSPTMEYWCERLLSQIDGGRIVTGANNGHSGHTTFDFRPSGGTGSDYAVMKSSVQPIVAANPSFQLIHSLMFGGNDSASSGTNNGNSATGQVIAGSLSPAQYQANLITLIAGLLSDFPGSKVIVHREHAYSDNWQNSSVYLQTGLGIAYQYRASTTAAVASFATSNPGQVFEGDTLAHDYFLRNYQTELTPESVVNGTAFTHPNTTGAQSLGTFHGLAIAQKILGLSGSQNYQPWR